MICENKKARFNYTLESELEVGMLLEGWEVKAIRAHRVQITDAYVVVKDQKLYVIGMQITPLNHSFLYHQLDPLRTRELLAHRKEIDRLMASKTIEGYTLIPLNLHWSHGKVKMQLALAKGKKLHDKRQSQKEKEAHYQIRVALKQHQKQ